MLKSHNSPLKAIELQPDIDTRLEQLRDWLGTQFGAGAFSLKPASADASFRRYFRVAADDARSWIAMDAPPEREDCRPFVRVAGLLRAAGVNAPRVIAQDLERGFLLLTDLGDTTYLAALERGQCGPAVRRRDRGAASSGSSRAARGSCRRTTRRCCGASAICFPSGTSRATRR